MREGKNDWEGKMKRKRKERRVKERGKAEK